MSTKDRDRFSRGRRDLLDALQLWRMLAETPEEDRDESLAELVVMAERSLADASEEYLQAGLALGYPRMSASVRPTAQRVAESRAMTAEMKTEDLIALAELALKPD